MQQDRLVHCLLSMVRTRDMKAGDRLPSEREIAEGAGASRPAVREALRSLTGMGMIETRRGSGSTLARDGRDVLRRPFEVMTFLDRVTVEQLFEVREHLEIPAAGLAAERRTAADLDRMEGLLAELEAAPHHGDRTAELNRQFHLAVAEASGNPVLGRLLQAVLDARADYLAGLRPAPGAWKDWAISHVTHRSLLAAIRAGNANAARRAMTMDMEMAAKYWTYIRARTGDAAAAEG